MSTFEPLADRVLVDPIKEDEVTAGGVILPDAVQEKPQRGTVIAVGPGARTVNGDLIPVPVEVGQTVLFSKYGGSEVRVDGDDFFILREADVLGILRD